MECNCNAVVFLEDQEHQTHFLKNLREKAAERLASGTSRVFGNPFLASRCAALPHLAKKAKAKAQEEGNTNDPETPQKEKIPAKKKEKEAKKKEKKEAKEKKKSSPKKNKEKGKKKKTSEDPESKKKKKKGEETEEESSTDDESSSDGESSSD